MISAETGLRKVGGRPKKPVKKEKITGVRFTKLEYYVVKQRAAKAGVGISTYIRQMALQGKLTARMSEEERQFVRQFVGIANNLNQLTKKAHQEGLMSALVFFEKYKNQFDELLNRMRK